MVAVSIAHHRPETAGELDRYAEMLRQHGRGRGTGGTEGQAAERAGFSTTFGASFVSPRRGMNSKAMKDATQQPMM